MLNLDGLEPDELNFAAIVFEQLAAYAKTKARAMRDPAAGNIQEALAQESLCDSYYRALPDWAKW